MPADEPDIDGEMSVDGEIDGEVTIDGGINRVVRIGATIRRPIGPWSASVHELLRHLEARGFDAAPRFLGLDDRGREVLSRLPGQTPWPPGPDLAATSTLESAAALLRRYHDAVAGWSPSNSRWQVAPVPVGEPEVICHNDVAPWNLIVRDGRVTGLVDWDTAAPGPRAWDLAYLAYTTVPLAAPSHLAPMGWPGRPSIRERLAAIRRGYGCGPAQWDALLTTIPIRVRAAYDTMRIWAAQDRPGWRAQWEQSEPWRHGAGYRRDLDYLTTASAGWRSTP